VPEVFRIRPVDNRPNAVTDSDRVATFIDLLINGAENTRRSVTVTVGAGEYRGQMTLRGTRSGPNLTLEVSKSGGGVLLSGPYTLNQARYSIGIRITSVRMTGLGRLATVLQRTATVGVVGRPDGTIDLVLNPVTRFRVMGTTYQSVSSERFQ
jgi:hypothetical protein